MPSIEDLPPELLLSIFEYLDIAELFIINVLYRETLSSIIARVARKTLEDFLRSTKPTMNGCLDGPELASKSQFEDDVVFARPDGVQECYLLSGRCFSLSFQTDEIDKPKMTVQLNCKAACKHSEADFHPCCNGREPAEFVVLSVNFLSEKKLPDGSAESIRMTYRTAFHAIQVQLDEEIHEGNQKTRTLSHRMHLWNCQWRTSTMDYNKGAELPREWINFRKDIDIVMQFKQNPAVTHFHHRRPDFRCSPYQLISFRADWSFLRLDGQMGPQFESNETDIPPHTSGYPSVNHAYSNSPMDLNYAPSTSKSTQVARSS
jgi:hypothetical protein